MATISFIFTPRSTTGERAALFEQLRQQAGVLDISWLIEGADDPELARTALVEVRDDAVADVLLRLRGDRLIEAADPPAPRYLT